MSAISGVLNYFNGTSFDEYYPKTTASQVTGLATVATSGSYNDLSNKPTIPTSSTVSGWGFGKITGITMNGSSMGASGVVDLGDVVLPETIPDYVSPAGLSGSYDDLTDKPTIPTVPSAYTSTPSAVSSASGSAGSSTSWARGDHTHKLTVSNKAAYLSWGSTITIATIGTQNITVRMPSNPMCLAKGTEIAMWDGTTKNIEDVEIGDELIGYNPITKENIKTIVLDARCEGATTDQLHEITFDDGSCLITAHGHDVFNVDEERPINIDRWHDGMKGLTLNGNEVELFANVGDLETPEEISYYNIDTDCATYYANGILCGSNEKNIAPRLYNMYKDKIGEDDEILELVNLSKQLYSKNAKRFSNDNEIKQFRIRIIESYKKGTQAISIMNSCLNELNNLDYYTDKYVAGKITKEEFDEAENKKQAFRNIYNEKKQESEYWRNIEHQIRGEMETTMGCGNDTERYNKMFELLMNKKDALLNFALKIKNYKGEQNDDYSSQ